MGNCCTIKKTSKIEEIIGAKLVNAIDQSNLPRLKDLINKYVLGTLHLHPILNINKPIAKLYGYNINALGYALFLGNTEAFIFILENTQAKLADMTHFFTDMNRRPIDILCEHGHTDLLEYYLPLYLCKTDEIEEVNEGSISLSLIGPKNQETSERPEKQKIVSVVPSMPAVQKACEKEKLGVLKYLWEYFQGKCVPHDFDVHYRDEYNGENCALMSCKTGNLEVMQYLFNVCKADFHIFNKRKENAVQIMAVNSKRKKEVKFLFCFKYLIEVIRVDYTYEFEETLLILQDKAIIEYFEKTLRSGGISIDKSKLEDKYSVGKSRIPPVLDPKLENKLSRIKGTKFSFRQLFEEELEDSNQEISSITPVESLHNVSKISFIN